MDAEAEAARAWQELLLATRRLHLELRSLVRAGRLNVDQSPELSARLAEADDALDAWSEATERYETG
jgi:hypothetical protein